MQQGERMRAENGELRLPHSRVNIRITKPVEIYPELSPAVGQIYPAERYSPPTRTKRYGYVIKSGGKRINIRRSARRILQICATANLRCWNCSCTGLCRSARKWRRNRDE